MPAIPALRRQRSSGCYLFSFFFKSYFFSNYKTYIYRSHSFHPYMVETAQDLVQTMLFCFQMVNITQLRLGCCSPANPYILSNSQRASRNKSFLTKQCVEKHSLPQDAGVWSTVSNLAECCLGVSGRGTPRACQ